MAMTVYVVTSGEYSDYRIVAIFSTKQMAKDFVAADGGDTIDAHELDTWIPDQGSWTFEFHPENGMLLKETQEANLDPPSDETYAVTWMLGDPIRIVVKHGNRERALKVASERYTRIRAHMDEAAVLLAKAQIDAPYPQGFALEAAEVLAGLTPAPKGDSTHNRQLRQVLGL